ncbi:MAG: hypothetical protein KDI11_00940 [Alphaproteobacteria bacterium]|nr:hypothetical protein [Alphaproteobacteria bacterium]
MLVNDGKVTLAKFEDGQPVEREENSAIWEMMYFGEARPPSELVFLHIANSRQNANHL